MNTTRKRLHRMTLQKLLRDIRLDANLRQGQIAKKLGVPQSFVSKYENGERMLDIVELSEVCDALGISLEDFIKKYERLTS